MVRLFGRCVPIICMPRKKRQSLPIGEHELNGTRHHQDEVNKLFVRRVESIRVTQKGAIFKRLPILTINERHQQHKKTKSKTTQENAPKTVKPDDTEFDCETNISDRQSKLKSRTKSKKKSPSIKQKKNENSSPRSRTRLGRFFTKTKKPKEPSPAPSSDINIPENDHDDTTSSMSSTSSLSSDWSTSTYPDSNSSGKSKDLIDSNQRRQSMPNTTIKTQNHDLKHQSCVDNFLLSNEHARNTSSLPANTSLRKTRQEDKKNICSQPQLNKQQDGKPSAKSKQVLQNVRKMMHDQSIQDQHFNDTRQRESVRL
ncbi:unnamed protein product [Rotaria magnacalcarata]|uniref:Uncharacterized protein n=2 Tax=Rotaria magnacalcarata TaxID=392030 RepID=A0A815JDF1_9BILA|nr:unnamed protein product [Rotaria magnacalcarata]